MRQKNLLLGAALCVFAGAAIAKPANWGFDLSGMDRSVTPGDNFFD